MKSCIIEISNPFFERLERKSRAKKTYPERYLKDLIEKDLEREHIIDD